MFENEAEERRLSNRVRDAGLQKQLLARREKLRQTLPVQPNPEPLYQLLQEVDAALERMEGGTFGLCETCHEEIENDRLRADPLCRNCLDHLSRAERQALERDLDLAFEIQNGLLPKSGAALPGWRVAYHYQPAGPVSGDYLDLITLDDRSCLFLLGDVMGKGVAASMLTTHLHAIFRSLCCPPKPVHELVAKANRVFCEGTLASFFATLVCGRLSCDGEIDVCNAGHCPPLHLRGGRIAEIPSGGLPLGLFPGAEYSAYHAALAPGDGLLIHTDGLSETMNGAGDQYGSHRLAALLGRRWPLPPDKILAVLLEDLDLFRGNTPLGDDLSVMVLGREA